MITWEGLEKKYFKMAKGKDEETKRELRLVVPLVFPDFVIDNMHLLLKRKNLSEFYDFFLEKKVMLKLKERKNERKKTEETRQPFPDEGNGTPGKN